MAEPRFSNVAEQDVDDDLPRTLRREHEARARQAREASNRADREAAGPALNLTFPAPEPDAAIPSSRRHHPAAASFDGPPATVTRLDIPFLHLMTFFLKAVIAAIPALILLLVLLWLAGEALTATFPDLVKMQVLIRMPY